MHLTIVILADTPSQKNMDLGWGRYGDNGNNGNQRLPGWGPDKAGSVTQKTGRGGSSNENLRNKLNPKENTLIGLQQRE